MSSGNHVGYVLYENWMNYKICPIWLIRQIVKFDSVYRILYLIEIVLTLENVVAWELGENGINSMYVIICSFDMNWEIAINSEHDILVGTFEIVDMRRED